MRSAGPRTALLCALAGGWLSACDSSPPTAGGGGGSPADPVLPEVNRSSGEDPARLLARAQAALALLVPNARAAHYADVRSGSGGAICGKVEIGATGVLYPFLVLPGGSALVSTAPELRLEDPEDPFPDLYMQHCASVEELRQLGAQLSNGSVPAPARALPDLPPAGEPVDDAPLPDEPPVRPAPPAAPRGSDDSFFNAIVRAPPEAAPHR